MNPQYSQFQIWLQNQKMMGAIPIYANEQQAYPLYQQFVFMNFGYTPPPLQQIMPNMMGPMPVMPNPVAPQPVPITPTTSKSQNLPISSLSQQGNQIKELIPRNNNTDYMNVGNGQNIMNITLNASTGNKTVINASSDTTIESLLKMYTKKLGLSEDVIGNQIMFLYNGAQLDFKSKSTIGSLFRNTAVITVYDLGGIIGA